MPPALRYPAAPARPFAALLPAWRRMRVLLALLPGLLAAQERTPPTLVKASELKRMSVEDLLKQEVVSASRRPEALGKVAANIFYLNGDASRGTGATTLPELLRLAPTLFVAQTSASEWGVNARGFMRENAASNKLLVLIDGRTAYRPLYSNVFWDTTEVFLPDLDSIEVISGPAGSNWGSNAVNGVINIRSKSARETLGGLLVVSGGTDGSQAAVRQGFSLANGGAMRVYAQHTERESTLTSAGVDDDHDKWRSSQAGFRADWARPDGDEWTVQGEWMTGHYDARPLPPIMADGGHLMARWSRTISPESAVWVRAFHDYALRDTNDNLTEETNTSDLEFQHTLALGGRQQFLWGANYRRIHDVAKDSVGFAILPRDLWLDLGSVFAQHDIAWHDDALRLTTGLRLEHNDFTGWEYQPTMRLAWVRERSTAWVAATRATRTPSRIEKGFFAPAEPPYFIGGGPDFISEIINSYELGWRGQLAPGASVTATAYHHRYDNLRSVEPTAPIVQANGVEGKSYGLELFLDYDVNPAWRVRAGGFIMQQETWLKASSADLEGGKGEGSFPRNQLFVRSNFRLNPRVDLWLSLRRVAEVPAYESGNGIVPAYTGLDAQLRWQVRPSLQLALTGRSLLNPSHAEIGGETGRREVRRSVGASLRWEY